MAGILSVAPVRGVHERRIVVSFSAALGAGAFSAGRYTVTSLDGRGVSPAVVWVYPVTGMAGAAELVLANDLVKGGNYTVAGTSVPLLVGGTVTDSAPLYYGGAP